MKTLKTESKDSNNNEAILSPRELVYLKFVSEGLGTDQIAAKMGVSVRTVETWREKIISKTEARKIIQVVSQAIRSGLI